MKITVDKSSLQEAIVNVCRAVSPKSPMPVLEGILFSAEDGKLTLTGYDLEMAIKTTLAARVDEPGRLVLTARLIADIVRRMPADTVTLDSDEKDICSVKSGRSSFKLIGISAQDFPALPDVENQASYSFPQYLLKDMIGQTRYAVSQSESMPVHKGSLFNLDGEKAELVSVDGCRLALRVEPYHTEAPARFIVPGKALNDIEKMLSDDRESENQVVICPSRQHASFTLGDYQIISRLLEGNFLDYRNVIPAAGKTKVTLNTRDLIEAIDRTQLMIADRMKNPLRCAFGTDSVTLSVNTSMGHAEDTVDCAVDGDPLEIGFNAGFLLDALRNANTDKVTLSLTGPISAMTIRPSEGESFVFLVLPVRIKN